MGNSKFFNVPTGKNASAFCTNVDSSSDEDLFDKWSKIQTTPSSTVTTTMSTNGYHYDKRPKIIKDNEKNNHFDKRHSSSLEIENFEQAPLYVAIIVYVQYAILVIFGYFRDLLRTIRLANDFNCPQESSSMKVIQFAYLLVNNAFLQFLGFCTVIFRFRSVLHEKFVRSYSWFMESTDMLGSRIRCHTSGTKNWQFWMDVWVKIPSIFFSFLLSSNLHLKEYW